MIAKDNDLICRRCGRPVLVSAASYEVFEQMHYVCFHYEFEHDPADPDVECTAGGCPSGAIAGGRDRVVDTAKGLADKLAVDAAQADETLPRYLEALAAWLGDSDGYYANQRRVRPSNPWEIINDALRAAAIYE